MCSFIEGHIPFLGSEPLLGVKKSYHAKDLLVKESCGQPAAAKKNRRSFYVRKISKVYGIHRKGADIPKDMIRIVIFRSLDRFPGFA